MRASPASACAKRDPCPRGHALQTPANETGPASNPARYSPASSNYDTKRYIGRFWRPVPDVAQAMIQVHQHFHFVLIIYLFGTIGFEIISYQQHLADYLVHYLNILKNIHLIIINRNTMN